MYTEEVVKKTIEKWIEWDIHNYSLDPSEMKMEHFTTYDPPNDLYGSIRWSIVDESILYIQVSSGSEGDPVEIVAFLDYDGQPYNMVVQLDTQMAVVMKDGRLEYESGEEV